MAQPVMQQPGHAVAPPPAGGKKRLVKEKF